MVQNKGLVFRQIPVGLPKVGQDLVLETRDFDPEQVPPEGGITTKNYYVSYDPYMRGRLRDAKIKSYAPAFELGAVVNNHGIARVLKSAVDRFKPGDLIVSVGIGMEECVPPPSHTRRAVTRD